MADHIDYLAAVCGHAHVGLGSDFDGIHESVEGLEDASKFPNLVRPFSSLQLNCRRLTSFGRRLSSSSTEAGLRASSKGSLVGMS